MDQSTARRWRYRWADVVPGFAMPVEASVGAQVVLEVQPTEAWQTLEIPRGETGIVVDPDYYVGSRKAPFPTLRR